MSVSDGAKQHERVEIDRGVEPGEAQGGGDDAAPEPPERSTATTPGTPASARRADSPP